MSQPFTRRARVAYYLAWLPMAALVSVVLNLQGMAWWEAAILGAALCVPFALVCGSSYFMARAMPLRRTRLVQVLLSLGAAATAASGAWAGLAFVLAQVIGGSTGERLSGQVGVLFGIGVAFFVLSLAFHYLILALEETRRAERRTDEARVLTREAELRALRAQVDPHFLFNSLNSVAALTAIDPARAREMCQLLSDFFRTTLRLGDRTSVGLGDEIALARKYLDIEQVRFEDRMSVGQQVDETCLGVDLPALLLQPLVENAVKHGVAGFEAGGRIDLEVRRDGEQVLVTVENGCDEDRPRPPGGGRGLAIVEDRLRSFYGGAARMVVGRTGDRFRVRLELPGGATDRA
jgi:sensor histidine kinase YesM